MSDKQLLDRRSIRAAAILAISAVVSVAYGRGYGSSNQQTYLLEPLHRAHSELFARDWLISNTTQYHPVFAWLVAPFYAVDPGGVMAFALAQLVVMIATYVLLYRLIAAIAVRGRIAMFLLLVGLLAFTGGRALAGSYLFSDYLQPSSLATLGWLAAMVAWLRGQPLRAGVWLALGGVCHVNFLVLGVGLFAALEVSSWRPGGWRALAGADVRAGGAADASRRGVWLRRLAAVVGPSLIVVAVYLPSLIASAHARDPDAALHILVKFHAPGHYDPLRVRRGLVSLLSWLVIAWGAVPVARAAGQATIDRLWRFAAVATALCVAATAVVSIPAFLGATRLFVWRIGPFAQLASQLVVIGAALAPAGSAATWSPRRKLAAVLGALAFLGEALLRRHYVDAGAMAVVGTVGLASHWLRYRALALALAIAACGAALVDRRRDLIALPLFAPVCDESECALGRWAQRETPADAVFLVPPYVTWFRLFAARAIVVDSKSPPLYPDELLEWYRRMCAVVDARDMPTHEAVEARWDTLTAAQLLSAARRFDAGYILLVKRAAPRLSAPVAYEDKVFVVYRLP